MVGKVGKFILVFALVFIFIALIGGNAFKDGFNDGLEDAAKPVYTWLLDETTNGSIRVVKAEITDNLTKGLIVGGCYIDIVKYINNEDLDGIDELQYWAVDTEGKKAVSFTINGMLLEQVKSGDVLSTQLEAKLTDLWITPTLR